MKRVKESYHWILERWFSLNLCDLFKSKYIFQLVLGTANHKFNFLDLYNCNLDSELIPSS